MEWALDVPNPAGPEMNRQQPAQPYAITERPNHRHCPALLVLYTLLLCLCSLTYGQTPEAPSADPRRLRVADESGVVTVGRQYGPVDSRLVLLPDGRIASFARPVYTEDPFQPVPIDSLRDRLSKGEYKDFKVEQTDHYLIFYQCSEEFAQNSARLLESLYKKLIEKFQERGFAVADSEFPLVAIIFRSEEDFRRHREVDSEVQAYYEIMSNRIFFYETSERQLEDAQFAAMRKPQTVTHEGTHQILQNMGVQPRLAAWPPWLVEGMAELAAASERKNGEWVQFSQVNPLHIATLEDLRDTQFLQGNTPASTRVEVGRAAGTSMVEYLISKTSLTPTDYSLSWALTHYLANKQTPAFLNYLKEMSQLPPGVSRTTQENQALFVRHFGSKFRQIDSQVEKHLAKLRSQTNLVYYGVVFEQPLPGNRLRRGTLVSRSPQVIREWVTDKMPDPQGGSYRWQATEFRTRLDAVQATENWISGN